MSHHTSRRQTAIATALLLMLALVGCGTTGPITNPTPTPSASEDPVEIAIREAKQAFLNYVVALSAIRPEDQSTLDAAFVLSTGNQREADRDLYEDMRDAGWTIDGEMTVTYAEASQAHQSAEEVSLDVCLDVSNYHTFDGDGQVKIPPNSGDVRSLTSVLVYTADVGWLVSSVKFRSGGHECAP